MEAYFLVYMILFLICLPELCLLSLIHKKLINILMKNIIKILSLLAFYFLLGNSAIAGFTISGTTITQTGTDTDLS